SPPTGPARAQGPARQIGSRPTPHPHRAGDALRATASRSNVVPMPIGGRLGGAAAPAFEPSAETAPETSLPYAADMGVGGSAETALVQDPGPAPAAHASVPPAGVFDAPGPQPPQQVIVRQGLPVAAWMGIAMAGGAGVVLAFILGTKFLAPVAQPVPEATKEEGVPAKAEDVVPQKEGAVVLPEDVVVENTEPVVEEETDSKGASSSTRKSTKTTTAATKQPELSEEDRKRLAAMSGGTGGSFSNIGTKDTSDRATKQSSPLTAEQISSVVTKNKAQLQQCYSRSLRGVAATSAIRVNVTLRIGGSGRVTSVTIAGADLPGLSTCMQSAVKKWVFPASGQESATAFPIVFSPGG
ncbi:MAG: AgmX/PglI C-terminal domain-containing protein, partial [Myxococcales bacterium]|nr:AgmX/PglI C-terminal domain-containing protein [Myxococcales bacterium]